MTGEAYRSTGAVVPGEGKRFQSLNRGKGSLAIDLRQERGREVMHRLVPGFDVVVINYRPGVAERLGVDYPTLSAINPALIYAELTGFGRSGPMGNLGATDLVASAYSGLVVGDGKVDEYGAPIQLTPAISDYTTGLASAMAVCAALYHRRESGVGQLIEASLLRSGLSIQDVYVMRQPVTDVTLRDGMVEELRELRDSGASYEEQLAARQSYRRVGAGVPRLYYSGYLAKDGMVVLGCLTRPTRDGARRVLGLEHDDSDSPDYDVRDPENQRRAIEWRQQIAETISERTVAEWIETFSAEGVPVAPANIPEEMADDPQVVALGLMVDLEHEITGPQRVVGPIVSMSVTPTAARSASPALGSHTDVVLRRGGLSDGEIAELRAEGVIR